ncbi:enhancer of rudimentary [Umbelopsis sp. PMI_123]|nr:enhancer of rudimentary [Umbelopsis sp. PMI_123]
MTVHTLLLVQPTQNLSSRTYYDFNTVAEAMDHIATLYEQRLQKENPRLAQLQYRAQDLLQFIDNHREFVALVFSPAHQNYAPHDKEWVKDKLLNHLGRQQPSQPSRGGPSSNRSNIQSRLGNQRF